MKYWLFLLKVATAKYDYRWEYARCQNETIRAENTREKFFVQPSFPNVNNAEFDCIWRLQAPDGYRIKITWPVFHLDSCKVTELWWEILIGKYRKWSYYFDFRPLESVRVVQLLLLMGNLRTAMPIVWNSAGTSHHPTLFHRVETFILCWNKNCNPMAKVFLTANFSIGSIKQLYRTF